MAAPTAHAFLDRFPEFNEFSLPEESIQLEIDGAAIRLNQDTWGEQYQEGVLFYAAHLVVNKHRVKCCKLINKDNSTGYLAEYLRMRQGIISGDRVI